MSAKTAGYSEHHHKLGPGPLWHHQGFQLPAYISNIAKGLLEGGHDRSSAIAIAISSVKRWASGGGKVSAEVRAASAKAVAEWEALRAAAGGGSGRSKGSQHVRTGTEGEYVTCLSVRPTDRCVALSVASVETEEIGRERLTYKHGDTPPSGRSGRPVVELNVVASPAGVVRYKAPIGTPIVGGKAQTGPSRSTTAKGDTRTGQSGSAGPSSSPAALSAKLSGLSTGQLSAVRTAVAGMDQSNPAVQQAAAAINQMASARGLGDQTSTTINPGARTESPWQSRANQIKAGIAQQDRANAAKQKLQAQKSAQRAALAKQKASARLALTKERARIAAAKKAATATAHARTIAARKAKSGTGAHKSGSKGKPRVKSAHKAGSPGASWAGGQGWVQGLNTTSFSAHRMVD